MNGAQALIRTLVEHGVDTCFMNPGTSEMHFVAALDDVTAMRGVLALFEGVATGAADGYARMAGRPAATLLHLGPGLGNGLANLHNARRAHSPVVNIVGDHAVSHRRYDAQLQSDIETVARNVSTFVRTSETTAGLGADAAAAVAAAVGPPATVATLILPADVSWSEGGAVTRPSGQSPSSARGGAAPEEADLGAAAKALRSGEPSVVLIGGRACAGPALEQAADIAASCGARLLAETFPSRLERGAGRPLVERLAYLAEFVALQLEGVRHLVLLDASSPVSFFAYPGKPSDLVPEGCTVYPVAGPADDLAAALAALARGVGSRRDRRAGPRPAPRDRPPARSPRPPSARPSARCCPRGPSSPTRGTPRDCSPPAPPRDRPPTTGCASPGGPSARGCRWQSGRPWPRPLGGWWPSSPTAAPSTPCRRGGPWRAWAST